MLVIIKSGPDTTEGRRAVKLARDMAADVCLIQNGVHFALPERLEGFCGTAHVLGEDLRLRGLNTGMLARGVVEVDYDRIVDLMAGEDNVFGAF